jgi:hypothetical protein
MSNWDFGYGPQDPADRPAPRYPREAGWQGGEGYSGNDGDPYDPSAAPYPVTYERGDSAGYPPWSTGPQRFSPGQADPWRTASRSAASQRPTRADAGPRHAAPRQAPMRHAAPRQAPRGQASPGQASPRQAPPGQASPGQAWPRQAAPRQTPPGQAAPRQPRQAGLGSRAPQSAPPWSAAPPPTDEFDGGQSAADQYGAGQSAADNYGGGQHTAEQYGGGRPGYFGQRDYPASQRGRAPSSAEPWSAGDSSGPGSRRTAGPGRPGSADTVGRHSAHAGRRGTGRPNDADPLRALRPDVRAGEEAWLDDPRGPVIDGPWWDPDSGPNWRRWLIPVGVAVLAAAIGAALVLLTGLHPGASAAIGAPGTAKSTTPINPAPSRPQASRP